MRGLFYGYYRPTDDEFKELWQKATFVLDANVILNLYRYPSDVSQELINVLEKIKNRIWIPYQVALEYQRNRITVIAEQKKRYPEVVKLLSSSKDTLSNGFNQLQLKKRHSAINPDNIFLDISKVIDEHIFKINKLEKEQLSLNDEDPIRYKLDELFGSNIGKPFEQQKILDEIFREGELRYKSVTPPGYMDRKKGNENEPDIFSYNGLSYIKKYGDLLVWKQLLNHTKEKNIKHLIFLTDDEKEDWWHYENLQGAKKIGPRPELIQEIKSFGEIKIFYMYNSEQFLKYAKDYLQATVSDEAINQVRLISKEEDKLSHYKSYRSKAIEAEKAVYNWILSRYPLQVVESNQHSSPDFVVNDLDNRRKIGFEVKFINNLQLMAFRIKDLVYKGYYLVHENNFDELNYIIVVREKDSAFNYLNKLQRRNSFPEGIKVIIGIIVSSSSPEDEIIFEPILEMN